MRRRTSAPLLLNDIQKDQLQKMERRRTITITPADSSSQRSNTPDSKLLNSSVVGSFDLFMNTQVADERGGGRRKRHRNAMAYSINLIEPDTSLSPLPPPLPFLPPQPQLPPLLVSTIPITTHTLAETGSVPDSSAISSTLLPRTLRRKTRRPILRERSSCSLRRKALSLSIYDLDHRKHHSTEPPSFRSLRGEPSRIRLNSERSPTPLPPPPPPAQSPSPSRSSHPRLSHKQSQSLDLDRTSIQVPFRLNEAPRSSSSLSSLPPPQVPLGHPSRPLYTAIRKGMSRPSSPPPPLDLEGGGRRSLNLPAPSASPTSAGFSLSGEVELRLALAKDRAMDMSDDEFSSSTTTTTTTTTTTCGYVGRGKFDDGRRKASMTGSMRGRVRKIGRGLKELVGWKS